MDFVGFIWLCIGLCALLIELVTPSLFFGISLFFGGLAAMLSGFYDSDILTQIIIFVVITIVSLLVMRTWVRKIQATRLFPTNSAALIGKQGIVIKETTHSSQPGLIKIGGEVWTAYTDRHELLKQGATVEIVTIKGCHVVVRNVLGTVTH